MKHMFLFLLVFVVFIIIMYFIVTVMPKNLGEIVEDAVEKATGYVRIKLPKSVTDELQFLKFRKGECAGQVNIYEYKFDEDGKKKIFLLNVEKNSKIYVENIELEEVVFSSDTREIYMYRVYPGPIPPIRIITSSKPEIYIGEQ